MEESHKYLQIIIDGYCNSSNRRYLTDYFISKYKKAEKESFITANLFFDKCLRIVEGLMNNIEGQYYRRKNELQRLYEESINSDVDSNSDSVSQHKHNLDAFIIDEVQVHWGGINSFTGNACQIKVKDIETLRDSIKEAWNIVLPQKEHFFKPYKSYTRVLAIYFMILHEREIQRIPTTKEEIINLVKDYRHPNGDEIGKTSFYNMLKVSLKGEKPIYSHNTDDLKKKYPEDYEHAMKIFRKTYE